MVPVAAAAASATSAEEKATDGAAAHPFDGTVDSFLVEALQNPRHRLTVLRMELDIQRFMQNTNVFQFEFQHYPTSYLRCCAHRVAQHYGLQTVSLGSIIDGLGSRVVATKTTESKFPAVLLSHIPAQQLGNELSEVKIAIRPRPSRGSPSDGTDQAKSGTARTVEQREEEYDKARARIFSNSSSPERSVSPNEGKDICAAVGELDVSKGLEETERSSRIGGSRVAIFRDIKKDRNDPDYDRSYRRYTRSQSGPNFGVMMHPVPQPSYFYYEPTLSQFGQMSVNQASVNYNLTNLGTNPYYAYGCNQANEGLYLHQWQNAGPVGMSSFDPSATNYQVPFYHQQALSFEPTQHC